MTHSTRFPPWPPEWPEIAESISRAVRRGDWGRYQGEAMVQLATQVGQLHSVKHCRLVSSGSIGIELALRAVGVSPGDQVALCGYDYPGNFRAIELLGARPLLVDADPDSFSINPGQLDQVKDDSVSTVVVSHLYGIPAQIDVIRQICDNRRWKLVEDACQTPAMNVANRPAGSWGDVGVLSFGGSKPLTAGNGGALLTNDDAIASKLNSWLDRPSDATPMSELQAAALLPQLDRLAQCNQIRWETARSILNKVGWIAEAIGDRRPTEHSTFYKLAFLDRGRDALRALFAEQGLPLGEGYRSMHRSSHRRCGKIGDLKRCRVLGEQLCLLDHSVLLSTGGQRARLIETLRACAPKRS